MNFRQVPTEREPISFFYEQNNNNPQRDGWFGRESTVESPKSQKEIKIKILFEEEKRRNKHHDRKINKELFEVPNEFSSFGFICLLYHVYCYCTSTQECVH